MAVYKVIQDIEAEDKLLGPLTLKGFIYACVALACAFINFRLLGAASIGPAKWLLIAVFLGPMLLFGILASPLGREQPTEVWLLARIRFMMKSRLRIWDQSGTKQLVTVTAPPKDERQLTKNLSQMEVKSRLQALATTLDSRGWSVKNVAVNLSSQPDYFQTEAGDSDRLIGASSLVQDMPVVDVHEGDDILDEENNPTAQNFQTMMDKAEEQRKAQVASQLEAARAASTGPSAVPAKLGANQLTSDEQQLLNKIHQQDAYLATQHPIIKGDNARIAALAPKPQTAKIELANAGSDLSVASIAALANHGETVIKLHS